MKSKKLCHDVVTMCETKHGRNTLTFEELPAGLPDDIRMRWLLVQHDPHRLSFASRKAVRT